MKLLITGDLAITQPYNASTHIDRSVVDLFASSDINIVNLEAPVTESTTKILKTGPNLKAHRQSVVDVFKTLNVSVATLANNHLMDYGEQGVADTLAFCKEQGIATVGGGMNIEEAAKTLYIDTPEGKIAIANFAENEWIAATPTSAGFNPMDIIDNARQIQDARKNADYVIVIIHGGHEYYNLPSPRMQKQYRFYIDNGADLVVGHHTHCISGMETYKNKPIYYSLGNFLFTNSSRFEDWYKGIVLELEIEDNNEIKTKPIFVKQEKGNFKLSLIDNDDYRIINERFATYSNTISNQRELLKNWEAYVLEKVKLYDNYWSPLSFIKNKWVKKIITRLQLKGDNQKGKALALNLMRCESHFDMSKEVLNKIINHK